MFPLPVTPPVHYGTVSDVLGRFSAATREWFDGAFPAPTAAQLGAWESIASRAHTLVVAPTGSGKTLSAFLWSLDQLAATDGTDRKTRVLYISPLKALGVDVERNLRAPLVGITQTAKRLGLSPPEISVGVRSGDTPAGDRRALIKNPPDILITTPESLFLMLTSAARETLTQVDTVIVDEVHAVAGTSAAPTWPCRSNVSTSFSPPRRSASGCRRRCARTRKWAGSCPVRPPSGSSRRRRRRRSTSPCRCRSRT